MPSYTLCSCLLKNLDIDKKYVTDILLVFTQQSNPFKVALDKSDKILEIYKEIARESELTAFWLNLMTMKPTSFESINVETFHLDNEEDIFLLVCSSTKNQQKIIVNSHERWLKHHYTDKNVIVYNKTPVIVLDRDEAIIELSKKDSSTINAYSSVVASGNSTISETKLNDNEQ